MMQREPVVKVSERAARRMQELIETRGEGAEGIKLAVKTAGCSGLTYQLDFAREIQATDEIVEAAGVKLVIDPGAIMFVVGTEMDFVEDKLGSSFKFTNPNETGRCGCGESFTV
ncbi:MAG: HesB/IscA family protein [Geminicoccaceae bacterium]